MTAIDPAFDHAADTLATEPGVLLLRGEAASAFDVDGLCPALVARPTDVEGVSAVLRAAAAYGLTVVPRGGGTAIGMGNRPARLDLLLDLSGLDRLVEYRPRDLVVTAEAGMTLAVLQQALNEHGQFVALDPPLPERATVGGTLAANLSGPRRFRFGTARDVVIGTGAVLADGSLVKSGGRVVKNVAGYDLNKLFVGSAGMLGVITSATFKLAPSPPQRGMVVAAFDALEQGHAAAMQIAGSALSPLTLDLVSPAAAAALGGMIGGLADGRWLLVCELGGTVAAVGRSRNELFVLAAQAGASRVLDVASPAPERIYAGVRDFGHHEQTGAALLLQVAVLPSQVVDACRHLEEAFGGGDAGVEVVIRAGNGVIYAVAPDPPPGAGAALMRLRAAVGGLRGSVVVERCPPGLKNEIDVWGIAGPDVGLMRRVKAVFDPAGTLSPGRGPDRL